MKPKSQTIFVFLTIVCLLGWLHDIAGQAKKKGGGSMKKSVELETPESDDEIKKHIIELDSQYQRAVKMNDAAIMDRILADDFILVTGRGKVYSRSDLLKEARNGKTRLGRHRGNNRVAVGKRCE
jgi:hypothetical protein